MLKTVVLFLLVSSAAYAGEECAPLGGVCREACGPHETAVVGAFLDCTDKQECCVPNSREKQMDNEPLSGLKAGVSGPWHNLTHGLPC